MANKQICNICKIEKPMSEFYKNSSYTSGYESRCKECRKDYQKKWREKNRAKHRSYSKQYYHDNKVERSKYRSDWYQKNKEYADSYSRKWRRDHPVRMKVQRKIENAKRRARIENAEGCYTVDEWLDLKNEYGCKCLLCGKSEPDAKITPDHVIPLALGGDNTINNIQPLCWGCNASKQAQIADYR